MNPVPETPLPNAFAYRGHAFFCSAVPTAEGLFQPVVTCVGPSPPGARAVLPQDAEPYATEAEALRHAEQQAMKWVHEHENDGRGQG